MLTTEQVKQIAEYMWPDATKYGPSKCGRYIMVESDTFIPLGNEDNHLIFKALVDECKKRRFEIAINEGSLDVAYEKSGFIYSLFEDEFNNESICLAYLAVMESK